MQVESSPTHSNLPSTESTFENAYPKGVLTTLKFLCSLGSPADIAEEISQAAWARAWQYRGQLANPLSIVSWVNTIAKNMYWLHLSGEKRFAHLDVRDHHSQLMEFPTSLGLVSIFNGCTDTEKSLLYKVYVEGYTYREISKDFGVRTATLRVHMFRLLERLRGRKKRARTFRSEGRKP